MTHHQQTSTRGETRLPPIWLLLALVALPQIAETVLAPSLPNVAHVFHLSAAHTQWTMSIFFLGFAAGVFLWGRVSDAIGRRPAILGGLVIGLVGTLVAARASSFELVLVGRFVQAVGLATCSVTTQTILRDCLSGAALTRCFVTVGMVLAWSPAVGPLVGQKLSDWHGYQAVLWLITAAIAMLCLAATRYLRETRSACVQAISTRKLAWRMLKDSQLMRSALLVAGLNALVFSFYAAGPFLVGDLPILGFGWIGLAVALAGSLGAALNRRLDQGIGHDRRVRLGLWSVLAGVLLQIVLVLITGRAGVPWALAALPIFIGFGLAIPNILAPALRSYANCLGRAGALFGVAYYTMLGAMLAVTSALPLDSPLALNGFWFIAAVVLFAAHNETGTEADRPTRSNEFERSR
ncbi:MFS transporter [Burkholderia ubonensis]|uniref:multidrug effflux MFS transporter n=1 Tax=Burkholderia ubonensis TaxID=101571 RepID=UPI0007544981|nr:multidrug effflux MFS transporter [Burkholderia ubonensis]KWC37015.1 MFS transporter [Burkholderia ubonensis]